MHPNGSLPDYQQLFGDLDFHGSDESRSVYSPAAYLADLLQLLTGSDLPERRPDLSGVRLDGANSYTEVPYLDIVNEILADELDPTGGAHDQLATLRAPFGLPFSLRHERLRRLLHHLGTTPLDLYRRFALDEHPDVVAREYLELAQTEVDLYTTALTEADLRVCYGLSDGETFTHLAAVDRFRQAVTLTHEELLTLLHGDLAEAERAPLAGRCFVHQDDELVTLAADERHLVRRPATAGGADRAVPVSWFERVNRFVRLARRLKMSFQDLDLVLRSCCDNRLDAAALRRIAAVRYLQRGYDLPLDDVVALVAPMNTLGIGDGATPLDLFNRIFNEPYVSTERTVLRGSAHIPPAYAGLPELPAPHDLLAQGAAAYRRRTGLTDADLQTTVARFRARSTDGGSGPLDRGRIGTAALTLLFRVGRLTTALDVTCGELFDVLDALSSDPSLRRHPPFPSLLDPATDRATTGADPAENAPTDADAYRIVAGEADVDTGLWLLQTLLGVVRWMQATGLDSQGLLDILGAGPERRGPAADEERIALLDAVGAAFETVQLRPEAFRSARFGPRSAQVVHDVVVAAEGVVSPADQRLLRLTPRVRDAAYEAVTSLGLVGPDDFLGLGLDERFAAKIHTNLVLRGYLDPSGTLDAARLPAAPEELWLTGDFSAYQDAVRADLESARRAAEDEDGPGALYPSDLTRYSELSAAERAELYDNLIFNGHLDEDGHIAQIGADFSVDVNLGDLVEPVYGRLLEVADRYPNAWITLDPATLAGLPLTEQQCAALVDSLRFNGYLDDEATFTDPVAALELTLPELTVDVAFHPYRRLILDAIQGQLITALTAMNTLTPDDFRDLADAAAAQRVIARLDEGLLADGRIPDDATAGLSDPTTELALAGFTAAENLLVLHRLTEIIADAAPLRVDPAAVTALGFTDEERDELLRRLIAAGDLTPQLSVPADRVDWFGHVHHALDFAPEGFSDYGRDVFFLLHDVAVTLGAAVEEVHAVLTAGEAAQRAAVFAALQDGLGVPAATAEAICVAVVGGTAEALDLIVAPALQDPVAAAMDPEVRRAVRRIRGFAALAARLGLGADEVAVTFHDQDLTGKFAEPLILPPGVDGIDALLESAAGDVYLFRGRSFWLYEPGADSPVDPRPKALSELSDRFTGLAGVDAAFNDADGTAWLVGRDDAGTSHTFVRPAEHTRWSKRTQAWGAVRNAFSDGTRIDAAFVDEEGRTYLFRGEHYVRYSGPDYSVVDEGFPRRLGEWWEGEQRRDGDAPLPPRFRSALDAAFLGHDGVTYLFSGNTFVALGRSTRLAGTAEEEPAGAAERPVADVWGNVVNHVAAAERIDAAYVDGAALYVFAGDQVVRHSDSIENEGVRADSGYPQRLATHFAARFAGDVPALFDSGIDAALTEPGGDVIHLFRHDKTAAVGAPDASVVPAAQRWGVLGPVLPGGTVDAALLGLDGRTYLFSGNQYVRYTGADYTVVDPGHPRAVATDWAGLRCVDAAFVMDGATYLFGTAGKLFELPLDEGERTAWSRDGLAPVHRADLDAGRLPGALRNQLTRHGITVADDAGVTAGAASVVVDGAVAGPQWHLTAKLGLRLTLRKVGRSLQVHVTDGSDVDSEVERPYGEGEPSPQPFFVKYSTRDYTTPDAGYPRPLSENWWNLPDELVGPEGEFAQVDAVFTAADGRIHLFAGNRFVVFDAKRRWWSAPRTIAEGWDSLPFHHVDAAFIGADGRTYVFDGPMYVRYSAAYSRVDDRYPARITSLWGNVANTIARTGRVDATLVVQRPAPVPAPIIDGSLDTPDVPAEGRLVRRTYLFSGDQYVRYTDTADGVRPATVDLGYPQRLAELHREPGFEQLAAELTHVDAAFADRGNVYLFSGRDCHVVSVAEHRRHPDTARADVGATLVEDGTVYVEHPDGWHRYSALEGGAVTAEPALPRGLRGVPALYRTGLSAALAGTDGTTYLFQGTSCYNTTLDRVYPIAEEWGRPRNTIYHGNAVDAAFVAANGKTYVFSGDQFVVYNGVDYLDAEVWAGPLPIAEHFAGLTRVALAYVRDGVTHLFEPADDTGLMRLVTYSGKEYDRPDEEPRVVEADFWGLPEAYRPAGFSAPDAVLFTGDAMLLLTGGTVVQYDEVDRVWSAPRPLERIWRGIGNVEKFNSAFTGRDGATYFFFGHEFARYQGRAFEPRQSVQQHWGRTHNAFLTGAGDVVDAAFVYGGEVTYLFSGEQYVRYSTSDYRWVDQGYPKPIAGNLRTEEPFAALPVAVEDELVERARTDGLAAVDAVVGGGRNTYLFAGRTCHVVSAAPAALYDIAVLGDVRNTIRQRRRVDAALVTARHTYLFSGDQFVRYTGGDYTRVDDGYPRTIAGALAAELEIDHLPEEFHTGIDAAMRAPDGWTYLFAGNQSLRLRAGTVQVNPIAGAWGAVRNDVTAAGGPRAAFVASTGELYAFAGEQYVRYALPPLPDPAAVGAPAGEPQVPAATTYATVDEGYPRLVGDDWGALPDTFAHGIDGAFTLRGRTYLCREGQYVRYADGRYDTVESTFPQPFAHRWTDCADYRLGDLRTITRFAALVRSHRGAGVDLAAALAPAARPSADLYRTVADLFGWDVEELRWCRRNSRFLSDGAADETRFELEFLLELVELFGFTGPLGAAPSKLRTDVWAKLNPVGAPPDNAALDAAAEALCLLLARKSGPDGWKELSRTLHDELNLSLRDALVDAVLARDPGPAARPRTTRDLFEKYLIDVEMGARGMTSRVREAIAAVQLYVHRYLLNLEPADGGEEQRQRIKQWWTWMRNYRVWEANRKVFLYPENYLRPELRDTKTPAFETLERDLLQGEITGQSVERAYKTYLDEYTEVSRLTIAGGYVYTKDRLPDGPRRLVLFGRTKTDPRRYYFRRAEFGSREKLSATWEPWQPVGVRIDADLVHPVHAFGRVFVFWTVVEPVADDDPASGTVVARTRGEERHVTASAKSTRVRIAYSFQNLNGDWVPAQTLGIGAAAAGSIDDVQLLVLPRIKPDTGRMSVVVSCTYTVTPPGATGTETPSLQRPGAVLFELNPELYAEEVPVPAATLPTGTTPAEIASSIIAAAAAVAAAAAAATGVLLPGQPEPDEETEATLTDLATAVAAAAAAKAATADRVAQIFLDEVKSADVVRFDAPTGAESWPWFSVDHKGGSFLCRPVTIERENPAPVALNASGVRMPSWSSVDAAVELPGGTAEVPGVRVFFSNSRNRSVTVPPTGRIPAAVPIGEQWGLPRTVLPADGVVDAVLVRDDYTYVFSGSQYVRFTGTPFGKIDKGYPKAILGNDDNLPQWDHVDVACTLPGNIEVFLNQTEEQFVMVVNGKLGTAASWKDHWFRKHLGSIDAVMVTPTYVFLFADERYARLDHTKEPSEGNWFDNPDKDYPRAIAGNPDNIPTDVRIDTAVWRAGTSYYFDNTAHRYVEVPASGPRKSRATYTKPGVIATTQTVDAAWTGTDAAGVNRLYLTSGTEYVRYTLTTNGTVPDCIDDDTPGVLPVPVDTVLLRGKDLYVFSGPLYTKMPAAQEPSRMPGFRPIAGAWAELPRESAGQPFDAAMASPDGLYLFVGDSYLLHALGGEPPRPYERTELPFEIVRLTTGTASDLNRRLLSGGVPALLDLATQETDEVAFSTDPKDVKAIRVKSDLVDPDRLPSGSHLDFRSANGGYYWEIFFHAPLLIAHALNGAQRFEDARRWYEYIFDPTHPRSYWRFLPFLTTEPAALADGLTAEFDRTLAVKLDVGTLAPTTGAAAAKLGPVLSPLVAALRTLAPAVARQRDPRGTEETAALATVKAAATHKKIADALAALSAGRPTAAQLAAIAAMQERTLIAADLGALFEANGDEEDLLRTYREDPFDPHAIAALRPVAYRRAVVMGYVDNLLDWADMLFRQYTPESVDEARMLYVLAYDLLGERPERLGVRLLPRSQSRQELGAADLAGYFTRGGVMLAGAGEVHAGVGDAYFSIPENSAFLEYWTRVEDRLHKIRQSLNILGVSQPLPLFAPPLDPMALVQAAASGAGLDSVTAAAAQPPHYRFSSVHRRAQEAVDKLGQLGSELLSVLERGSAEELSLLQNRQEQTILGLTTALKDAQIRIAEENLAELTAGRAGAQERAAHYDALIAAGMIPLEQAQIATMSIGAAMHMSSSVLQIASSISHALPQIKMGPFIMGAEAGGDQAGSSLDATAQLLQSLGEGFQVIGEVLGVSAQYERMSQDWTLQLATARNDLEQLEHRIAAANQQLSSARREADIHARQIEHAEAVATFLQERFTNAELYGWMAARLSGLYFQAYHLTYELAVAAERAYQFEQGVTDSFIRPTYWESRRNGLLAGQSLALDLQRLGQAKLGGDARSLEITRQVSLLETDPVALLRLRTTGSAEFALTEALFDRDFPGHYKRQIRTVTVTFLDAEGQPIGLNATLTQLSNKTLLAPDPAAVKHLLDPKGNPPAAIRADWRASQRIALSQVDYGRDNNGLFELRFDDERYLPFEGTGAVSTWRLERSGRAADVYDVLVTVKYTAEHGGEPFAAAVKGMLKPYTAARFFDVAREFPEQWEDFVGNGADRLVLPITTDLFPGMASRRITGIASAYELTNGTPARLVLGGDPGLTLTETLLPAPGLTVRDDGPGWAFALDGDKADLGNVGLVVTYQARVE